MASLRLPLFVAVLLALLLILASPPEAAPGRGPRLHLKAAGSFDPVASPPRVAADLTVQAAEREEPAPSVAPKPGRPGGKVGHWIVQFHGPVREEWKASILSLGGQLFDYLPDFAFAARLSTGQAQGVSRLPYVRSVQPFQPAYALSPNLPARGNAPTAISILTFTPDDVRTVSQRLRRLGAVIENSGIVAGRGMIHARTRRQSLRSLARAFGVYWIEPRLPAEFHDDKMIGITNVDDVRANVGLYGANQIIGVYDSGLDTGNTGTLHADLLGRVLSIRDYGDAPGSADTNGHGTHVAGTVLGNGTSSGSDPSTRSYPLGGTVTYAGVAPEAFLVFQSSLTAAGGLGFADSLNFRTVLRDAYEDGARVHSNSWGAISDGTYNAQCVTVDEFAYQYSDMSIIFSAGNSGVDGNLDGLVDSGSRRAPGVSKNVITVGASENNRPTLNYIYGSSYGSPINNDPMANNISGMAAFSSRGPCDDTAGPSGEVRIKPDLVAPGTMIAAPRTSQAFLTENFDTSTVGTQPLNWTSNGNDSLSSVTSADSFSSPRCYGFGNATAGQGYGGFTGGLTVTTPPLTTTTTGTVAVSFRTRYNLRPGDQAIIARGGSYFLSSVLTGASGGWVYRMLLVPNSSPTLGVQFVLNAAAASLPSDNYFWQIDDVRVVPLLTATLGQAGLETPGSARDEAYQLSNGTSMSCPAVAGMAGLTREYYQERRNYPTPSAALVKATLVTSAANMAPGQYGAPQEIPSSRPNSVNGWGRVDLQKALAPSSVSANLKHLFADVSTGLRTGGNDTYTITVAAGTALNVGLVWTDAPASAAAGVTLINDLDLSVDPDGAGGVAASRGNNVSGGDRRNNVETVDFAAPAAGTYTITVSGFNVPTGQQPYALVVYGNVGWQNTLAVSPATTTVQYGRTAQFSALLNGMPTSGVTWSLVSGVGSISSAGVYTAPASGAGATVRATYGALTADATITLAAASTTATVHFTLTHPNLSHWTGMTVGVGPNPASPIASVTANFASAGSGTVTGSFDASSLAGYLPPSSTNPWWLRVNDATGGSVGTIQSFYVVLGSGDRFDSTNTPATVGDTTGAPYAWIDPVAPTAAVSAPAAGSTVSGSVAFSATATDNDRISRVDFYVDDRLIGTDTSSPYSVTWNTALETNVGHRLVARSFDASGNTAEDFRLVTSNNAGSRPNVVLTVGSWSYNSTTRELTATATFNNTGSADAFRTTIQRLTLFGTGPTFTGHRQVYMEPVSGGPFPRNLGTVNAGASTTLNLTVTLPPEVTAVPRWAGTGTYYNAASGGTAFFM